MDQAKKNDGHLDPGPTGVAETRPLSTDALHEDVIPECEVDDDDTPELKLAPPDPHTDAARRRMREADLPVPVAFVEEPAPRYQFSLLQILIVNTALAVAFALMQAIAPSVFAGALGGIVLLAAILLTVYQPERRGLFFAWWGLLALYVISSLVAVFGVR